MTTDREALLHLAYEAAREELSEYRQQDDYLLAHGASLLSDESHEIFHVDALRRAVNTAVSAALSAQGGEQPDTVSVPREPTMEMIEAGIETFDDDFKSWDSVDIVACYKAMLAAAKEGKK